MTKSNSFAFSNRSLPSLVLLAVSSVVVALLLLGSSISSNNQQPQQALVDAASFVATTVIDVDKTRLWLRDVQSEFRTTNGSAPALPRFANTSAVAGPGPYIAKHSAVYDSTAERIIVFGGDQEDDFMLPNHPARPLGIATNRVLINDVRSNQWYTEALFNPHVQPLPRMHHVAWMHGTSTMVVHGGIGDDSKPRTFDAAFEDIWKYHNRSWTRVQHLGPKLYGHCAVAFGGKTYIFGGTSGRQFSNRFYSVDHASANVTFTEIKASSGSAPRARAFHACAVSYSVTRGAEIIVFGGHDGLQAMNDLYSFSVSSKTWTLLSSGSSDPVRAYDKTDTVRVPGVAVPASAHHTCSAFFPILLCIGGSNTQPIVLEYDLSLRRWINSYTQNKTLPPLVHGKSFGRVSDETGLAEMWIVGGLTMETLKFSTAASIVKANFFTEACPTRFVNPDFAAGRCYPCPSGTIVIPERDPHSCDACPVGTYESVGVCKKCPAGTYNPANASSNASSCIACPAGFFTVGDGAGSLSECVKCPLGTYAQNAACLPCPAGSYGVQPGTEGYDQGCSPCPYGEYSKPGQVNCTACPPGTSTGPFVERTMPYKIYLRAMNNVLPGQVLPGGCPGFAAPVTQVIAGTYFYVVVTIGDVGRDGTNYPYMPLRQQLSGLWPVNPSITVEYDGQPSRMYYSCNDQNLVPSCSFRTRNATTPPVPYNVDDLGCASWYQWHTGFLLRFDDPTTDDVTITFRSGELHPLVLQVKVVAFGTAIDIVPVASLYVASQRVATQFRALDLLGRFDGSASDTVSLGVVCASGTPGLLINGIATSFFTFTNGVFSGDISFTTRAENCQFRYTRNSVVTLHPPTFTIQQGSYLLATTGATNMTNGGWLQVSCSIVDFASGTTMFGDNISDLQLALVNNSFTQYWTLQPPEMRKRVAGGVAHWMFQIFSAYPVPSTVQSGQFVCSQVSGGNPLVSSNATANFNLNGVVNGTHLRINTDFGPWPTEIAANETFHVSIERFNPMTGGIDGSRSSIRVQLELSNCPGVRLHQANRSAPFITLLNGRATASIKFVGPDRTNCVVLIREVGQPDPQRRLKAVWTPYFDIITPTYLSHDGCPFTSCATCTVAVGTVVPITVTVHSADGNPAINDQRTIVKLSFTGNLSGAVELTGTYERKVTNGNATFQVKFLLSTVPVGMLFLGGRWIAEAVWNTTYQTAPVFSSFSEKIGEAPIFYRTSVVPVYTCPMPIDLSATRMRLIGRVPDWVGSSEFFPLRVEAVNDFGTRAAGYTTAYTISVTNCHHGFDLDTTRTYRSTTVPNGATVVNGVTGANFLNSVADFEMAITYSTQTHITSGMLGCSIRVNSGTLPELVVEGFEIRRIFRSCRMCSPGTWSPGGSGVNNRSTFHPGGCMKCMIGTFATTSGASDESQCEVCSTGDGWVGQSFLQVQEGLTSCPQCGVLNTTVGLPGGGGCPDANIQQYGATSPNSLGALWLGRLGRRCSLSQCFQTAPCSNGYFRLFCANYGANSANCNGAWNKGLCSFNTTTNTCSGAAALCVPCPPGTVGNGQNNADYFWACRACAAGQYSENEAHTQAIFRNIQYEDFRCAFTNYQRWCTGSGTGICPNGTYQPNTGATSNTSCLTCPAGTYAHQVPMRDNGGCPSACPLNGGAEGAQPLNPYCPIYIAQQSCFRCPLNSLVSGSNVVMATPRQCTPCPPGTYNPNPGMWDPSHCKPCRAGTFCPQGSSTQNLTDPNASSVVDLTGFSSPGAVSFEGAGGVMSCANRAFSDYPGYIRDGGFSNWVRRYVNIPDVVGSSYRNEWRDQSSWGAKYHYDLQDRKGQTDSGSLRCNATGCNVMQNISVAQEIPEDLVIRAWVYLRNNQSTYQFVNLSKLYSNQQLLEGWQAPFAGFNVTFYSHTNSALATNVTYVAKGINMQISDVNTWTLVEAVYRPPFAVAVASFHLVARAWYNTEILFDDVALRPASNRICNCSTGFYYNASNPTRPCLRCPPGFMCAGGILKRCVNSWSGGGEPGCRECRANWMCDADGRGRSISCPKYTYKSNVTETCERCPNGHACQDGFLKECSGGRYGDGGLECRVCSPGFYSLPGAPRVECLRCPAGTTSNSMRTGCFQCPVDHYSPDGIQCLEVPVGTYAPQVGSVTTRPCDALFLQSWNYTVYRNSEQMLEVLPERCACIPEYRWRIQAIHHVSGQGLGEPVRSLSTKKTVKYTAGGTVGTHIFRVHLTGNTGATLQVALITVNIENRAPIARDDLDLTLTHPAQPTTYNLTLLLFNDYDLDLDNLFFATLTPAGAQFNATALTISPDRRTASVDLPTGFTGPALFQYTIMDEYHANVVDCVAPSCRLSTTANVRLTSKRVGPTAVDDRYDVLNGQVYSLDVTQNDYDIDGDDIYIKSTTVSVNGANPQFATTCTSGCASACRGVSGCTCAYDAERDVCWPSTNKPTIVTYTAPTSICGTDQFTYTIGTNDGTATATVYARIRRCFCATHNPPIYFNFVLDGTVSENDFAFQLGFVDALQKRSSEGGSFSYGIFVAGIDQVMAPFQNTYLKTQDLQWPVGMRNYAYNLGNTLTNMPAAMGWGGLPASRIIANIVISSQQSGDSVVGPDSAVKSAYGNFNYAISINPQSLQDYNHALLLNPVYKAVYNQFEQLVTTDAAQNTMDEICSL